MFKCKYYKSTTHYIDDKDESKELHICLHPCNVAHNCEYILQDEDERECCDLLEYLESTMMTLVKKILTIFDHDEIYVGEFVDDYETRYYDIDNMKTHKLEKILYSLEDQHKKYIIQRTEKYVKEVEDGLN